MVEGKFDIQHRRTTPRNPSTPSLIPGPDLSKSDEVLQGKNEAVKKRGKEDKRSTKVTDRSRNYHTQYQTTWSSSILFQVIIRKLPGTMTEESFMQHVSPLFEHDYFYFVQGENPSFGDHNYSRAYINFVTLEDVFTFTKKFDDYVFLDDSGTSPRDDNSRLEHVFRM